MSKGNTQHTDDIFKQKFEEFNIEPSKELWDNIEKSMAREKRKKILIISSIGIAASLLLLLIPSWFFNKSSFNERNNLYTKTNKYTTIEEDKSTKVESPNYKKKKNNSNINIREIKDVLLSQKSIKDKKSNKQQSQTRTIIIPFDGLRNNDLLTLNNEITIPTYLKENKELERIRKNIYLLQRSKETIKIQTKIQLNVGKSRTTDISTTDNLYRNLNISKNEFTDPKISSSNIIKSAVKIKNDFGINLEIPIKNRISLLTGVKYLSFTDDKDKTNTTNAVLGPIKDINEIIGGVKYKFIKEVKQEFSNIEIPIALKYYIINRKFSVYISGGVGLNLLIDNNADIILSDDSKYKSETEDLASLSWSGLIGFGVSYNINKTFYLSVEPHFRHYFNSLNKNNSYSIKPNISNFSFGLGFRF